MAKWTTRGFDQYAAYLQRIGKNTPEIIGAGVYAMADVVANQMRENIKQLPAVKNEANIATYRKGYSKLSEPEKEGLLEGFGISKLQNEDGYMNVKLGFDGYNSVKTKKYPKGQPNALIARITDSGSSYREKTPFVDDAVKKSKKAALQKGRAAIDEKISKIK